VTSGLLSQSERGYTITEKGRRLVQVLGRLGTFFWARQCICRDRFAAEANNLMSFERA